MIRPLVKRWNIEQKSTGLRSIGLNSSLTLKNRSTMKQISQFGSTGQLDKLTNTLTNFKRDSDRRKSVQMTSLFGGNNVMRISSTPNPKCLKKLKHDVIDSNKLTTVRSCISVTF